MKVQVLWEGVEMICHRILPLLRYWLSSPSCSFLCSLHSHPPPTSSPRPPPTWTVWNSGSEILVCLGGWTMQGASSVEVFPFRMSLFNFRVLLFLCEWNVRNEFHRVISLALTGLCHLSLDHGFTFGFLPCAGFWPISLSRGNFTSQYSFRWRSLLPGATFVTLRYGVISSTGFTFHYF